MEKFLLILTCALIALSSTGQVQNVSFSPVDSVYINTGKINLSDYVRPSGGTFSGDGITENIFDPFKAGMGAHTITYTYTDENGYAISNAQVIRVQASNSFAQHFSFFLIWLPVFWLLRYISNSENYMDFISRTISVGVGLIPLFSLFYFTRKCYWLNLEWYLSGDSVSVIPIFVLSTFVLYVAYYIKALFILAVQYGEYSSRSLKWVLKKNIWEIEKIEDLGWGVCISWESQNPEISDFEGQYNKGLAEKLIKATYGKPLDKFDCYEIS